MNTLFEHHNKIAVKEGLKQETNYYDIVEKYNRIRALLKDRNILENTYYYANKKTAINEINSILADFTLDINDLEGFIYDLVEALSFSDSELSEHIKNLREKGKYYLILEKLENIETRVKVINKIAKEIDMMFHKIYKAVYYENSILLTLADCIDLAQIYEYVKNLILVCKKIIDDMDYIESANAVEVFEYPRDEYYYSINFSVIKNYCDEIIGYIDEVIGNDVRRTFSTEKSYSLSIIFNSITELDEIICIDEQKE